MKNTVEELLSVIENTDEPEILEALRKARERDAKYQDLAESALNYEWVARVVVRVTGQKFTKGIRLRAGRYLAEQSFSNRSE